MKRQNNSNAKPQIVGWVKRSEPIITILLGALRFTQPTFFAPCSLRLCVRKKFIFAFRIGYSVHFYTSTVSKSPITCKHILTYVPIRGTMDI